MPAPAQNSRDPSSRFLKPKKTYIPHLDKMKPKEFIDTIGMLQHWFQYRIPGCQVTEKIDGSSLTIGMTKYYETFIQTSTSPEIYYVGDFEARDKAKGYSGAVGIQFDWLLDSVKFDCPLQKLLREYADAGIKIVGEILYVPMGRIEGDKITFVKTAYNKDELLGSEWTFMPYQVLDEDGNRHKMDFMILDKLHKISNDKRYYTCCHFADIINLREEGMAFNNWMFREAPNPSIFSSRKAIHKESKDKATEKIREFQKLFSDKILSFIDRGMFGPDYEGLVIKIPNGKSFKVVTEKFKNTEYEPHIK